LIISGYSGAKAEITVNADAHLDGVKGVEAGAETRSKIQPPTGRD